MNVDRAAATENLKTARPLFHPEAIFNTLAWKLHRLHPSAGSRLEINLGPAGQKG
jgi:hypothetical protein